VTDGRACLPDLRLVRLFTEVRQELGIPRPHHVLSERAFFEQISPAAAID
jgi:hypothetical protein